MKMPTAKKWIALSAFTVALGLSACDHEDGSSNPPGKNPAEQEPAVSFADSITTVYNILASTDSIANFIGFKNFKLVFRNENSGNLVYLDYTDSVLKFHEFLTDLDCYHPEISPDGRWVAFSTGYDGAALESNVYVLDLKTDNKKIVKLEGEEAAIPRWRILANGDTGLVYVSSTVLSQLDEWKTATTSEVSFKNGKFGKPRTIFKDGAFHEGISKDGSFAVTSSARLIVRKTDASGAYKDEVWYNNEQTCNASLFMDGTNRVSFLDLGGSEGVERVGHDYLAHQLILVVDSTGKLINSYPAPVEMYGDRLVETAFNCTEWVTGDIVISSLANVADLRHRKIMLINLADSTKIDIINGDGDLELWHPDLWFDKKL